MKEALDGKLLISILGGVTIAQLKSLVLPTTKVVRAMPNIPCRVRLELPHACDQGLTIADSRRYDSNIQSTSLG